MCCDFFSPFIWFFMLTLVSLLILTEFAQEEYCRLIRINYNILDYFLCTFYDSYSIRYTFIHPDIYISPRLSDQILHIIPCALFFYSHHKHPRVWSLSYFQRNLNNQINKIHLPFRIKNFPLTYVCMYYLKL